MVDLVGSNGGTERKPDKVCPLAWAPFQQQGPAGIQVPNMGLGFVAGNCVRERCGWWSEQHERCSMVSIAGLQSHVLEIADELAKGVHRMRPTVDELEDAGFRAGQQAAGSPAPFPLSALDQALGAVKDVQAAQAARAERGITARERVGDELRRLRHLLLGVYDAVRPLLAGGGGAWGTDEVERIGRGLAGEQRDEDRRGETPGEPG